MRIQYLDGPRLRRALLAACQHASRRRAELNRINVFPVPDGDTGTNLALTLASIVDRLRVTEELAVGVVAMEVAEAGILGARGNCGMILSHWLLGFGESIRDSVRATVADFTHGLRAAATHVYASLEKPVEGTIITVMREAAEEAEKQGTHDFAELLEALLGRARIALARTPELLPVLREAGVVDAGAKGFVHMLEGVVEYINGDPFVMLENPPSFGEIEPAAARAPIATSAGVEHYRYCTEALVRGSSIPDAEVVRRLLRDQGDSVIVIRTGQILKIHIHTDDPDRVFRDIGVMGTLVARKAEDMHKQHEVIERSAAAHVDLARRAVTVLTDTGCDLPEDIVRAHGIHLVPLTLVVGGEVFRDRVDMTAEEFVRRLKLGARGSTSQPAPAYFLEAYERAAVDGERVLGIILGSSLSGTLQSAQAAARRFDAAPIDLVDSLGASLLQGLLTLKAAELAESGMGAEAIAAEVTRIRRRSGLLFTVDIYDYLLASGRVGKGRVWLANLLDLKPVLGLDEKGFVQPLAKVRGRANVLGRMLDLLSARIPADAHALRFGVIHVAAPEILEPAAAALRERFGAREIIYAPASPVIAVHVGPGAWGIAWMLED